MVAEVCESLSGELQDKRGSQRASVILKPNKVWDEERGE